MPSNFSSLRSARTNSIAKLNEEIAKDEQKGASDPRFWKLTVDPKTKIGFARLRFLPAPKNEDLAWVRTFSHGFKHNGAWFIENCPTTLANRPCPVCKDNSRLWNTGIDADKKIASQRKRRLRFISNVLIVNDPAHPENEGKVFLFSYGKKIHEKIRELINPQYPDQKPTDPFDLWAGADFKLKSSDNGGFQNYDKSEFAEPSEVFPGDDAKKEALWESEHLLQPFVAENQFKTYDELARLFTAALTNTGTGTVEEAIKQEMPTAQDALNVREAVAASVASDKPAKSRARKPAAAATPVPAVADDMPEDEDDIRNFFASMNSD